MKGDVARTPNDVHFQGLRAPARARAAEDRGGRPAADQSAARLRLLGTHWPDGHGARRAGDRFATQLDRRANHAVLTAILDEIFAARDLSEWRPILEKAGVTFGAVCTVDEAAEDAQAIGIGALVPFADGTNLTVSSPFHLDGETKVAPARAPAVGEHSEAVLRDAGYAADEIAELKALGVLQ